MTEEDISGEESKEEKGGFIKFIFYLIGAYAMISVMIIHEITDNPHYAGKYRGAATL